MFLLLFKYGLLLFLGYKLITLLDTSLILIFKYDIKEKNMFGPEIFILMYTKFNMICYKYIGFFYLK